MKIKPLTEHIEEYIKEDEIIDYSNEMIVMLAEELYEQSGNETEYIRAAYEYVRDHISHSADINEDIITCSASEVLKELQKQ